MTKKITSILILQFFTLIMAFAQPNKTIPSMADGFREEGKIYVVITVASIILTGIVIFLIMLEKKISKLEKNS
jgi:hypothetical protein